MIKKSLGAAAGLLLAWSIGISWLPADLPTGQTLRGENLIRAEHYLYETEVTRKDIVLVGSSLSEKLTLEEIEGRTVHNLGLGGQSALDGLDLVLKAEQRPGWVFIETNILRPGNEPLLREGLALRVGHWFRRWVPTFRHRHQPVGVLNGVLRRPATAASLPLPPPPEDRPLNEESLARKITDYAVSPVPAILTQHLADIRQRVARLEAENISIAFYETPVAPELCTAPRAVALRKGFRSGFPAARYEFVEQPDCTLFRTTDGHHLGEYSNSLYSLWLAEQMEGMLEN